MGSPQAGRRPYGITKERDMIQRRIKATVGFLGLVLVTAGVVGLLVALGSSAWADDTKITQVVKDAKVTIDQAIKTASEIVAGRVVEAELVKKHGLTVWEVEILRADEILTEVRIDATTGAVINIRALADDMKITRLVKDAKVTIDQAIKTASEKVAGTLIEVELAKKHGLIVWEVEILRAEGNVAEVRIDANDGRVIATKEK
jgi:uncharacterized membrane protein YkoI